MIDNLFKVHILTDEGIEKCKKLEKLFSNFLEELTNIRGESNPPSRELSIIKTKLQEASFFAKREIAIHYQKQLKNEQ